MSILSFQPASEFNYGLTGFQLPVERRKGSFPYRFSFVNVNPENLILVAFKKAEDGDAVIMRLYETRGERTSGVIALFKKPTSVKLANLLEEEKEEEVKFRGRKIRLPVKPFEIVTLKIKF